MTDRETGLREILEFIDVVKAYYCTPVLSSPSNAGLRALSAKWLPLIEQVSWNISRSAPHDARTLREIHKELDAALSALPESSSVADAGLRGMLRHLQREFAAGKLGVRVSVPQEDVAGWDVFTPADVDAALARLRERDRPEQVSRRLRAASARLSRGLHGASCGSPSAGDDPMNQKRMYDRTVARIAGTLLSDMRRVSYNSDGLLTDSEKRAVRWAVNMARIIVAETTRTEPNKEPR